MNKIEKHFENFLWNSRLSVMTPVLASLLSSLGMFYVITIDTFAMVSHLLEYASLDTAARLQ